MGDKTTDDILEYRDTHGPIHDFSQFKEIFGIGDHTVKDLERHYSLD